MHRLLGFLPWLWLLELLAVELLLPLFLLPLLLLLPLPLFLRKVWRAEVAR